VKVARIHTFLDSYFIGKPKWSHAGRTDGDRNGVSDSCGFAQLSKYDTNHPE